MKAFSVVLIASALASAALAEGNPSQRCGVFQTKVEQTLSVTSSCSDALYKRRDADEASALCKSAVAVGGEAIDMLKEFRGAPGEFASTACSATERRPTVAKLFAANAWQINALTFLVRGGAEPGQFAAN